MNDSGSGNAMALLREILCRLLSVFRKRKQDGRLDEELQCHLEMLIEASLRAGLSPEEARRQARFALGGLEQTKEAYRDQRGIPFIETALRDLRYAFRLMRRSPGFTATAVLTLVVGIGANTTVFSIADAVLIRPLPYRDPDRIVALGNDNRIMAQREFLDEEIYRALRERSDTIAAVAQFYVQNLELTGAGNPETIVAAYVSPSIFRVLGVRAQFGRVFRDEEEQKGKSFVALIGHDPWMKRFAGDKSLMGKVVTLSGKSYGIVGVMPPKFSFPEGQAQIWVPMVPQGRGYMWRAIARLRDGITPQQALAEVNAIKHALSPGSYGEAGPSVVYLSPLHDVLARETRVALTVLFTAVAVVLLIACANLANLMAARSRTREKEFAIRTALGATRGMLIRQSLAESLLLSLLGGALGSVWSYWAVRLFVVFSPMKLRSESVIGLDFRVLTFTVVVSVLTGAFMGIFAVWEASKTDVQAILKDAKRSLMSGFGLRLGRGALVVFQVAVGLTLMVAGGLIVHSFIALISVDPGYEPNNVLTAEIRLPDAGYPKRPQQAAFYQQLTERLMKLPEVEGVAVAGTGLPLTGKAYATFQPEGWAENGGVALADFAKVSPSYFMVMRLHLLEGRFLSELDTARTPRVVVINESLAKRYFAGMNPIGKTIESWNPKDPPNSIVGVVADVKHYGLDKQSLPCLYYSTLQPGSPFGISDAHIAIRTRVKPERLIPALRAQIAQIDKSIIPEGIKTMNDRLWESVAQPRFYTVLMGCLALSALALVLLGTYGVVAYAVSCRTREIGLRIALGAQSGTIYRLIISQSVMPTLLGIGAGIAGSLALTRFLSSMLFGIQPHDPATFVALPVFLAVTVVLACYLPARRAARLDPLTALKEE